MAYRDMLCAHKSSFAELTSPTCEVTDEFSYLPAPELLGREHSQVHVWCAVLSEFAPQLPLLHTQLSSDERAHAERFRFPRDRNRFIARRGILRRVLSWYVDRPPAEIDFCYGQCGKPEIRDDFVRGDLQFSVSHSEDLALYAVTRECPIGVDVEYVRPVPDLEEIASQFFSRHETGVLMMLPPQHRHKKFLSYWTCKEALLKATGEGIGEALASVHLIPTPQEQVQLTQSQSDWQLRSFSPAPGYLAAVASRESSVDSSLAYHLRGTLRVKLLACSMFWQKKTSEAKAEGFRA